MKLAVIAGDGIGPEVISEALGVLTTLVPDVAVTEYDLGARRYHRNGELLTDDDLASLREHDAILLGAIGDPSVPSGVLERGLLLKMRFALDHHVNLRPSHRFPGVTSPLAGDPDIDFVVVREGTEGPYTGNGGAVRVDTPHDHGAGDTLAAGIACALAHGFTVPAAIDFAKQWVTRGLRSAYPLGSGHGPVNPLWRVGPDEQDARAASTSTVTGDVAEQ